MPKRLGKLAPVTYLNGAHEKETENSLVGYCVGGAYPCRSCDGDSGGCGAQDGGGGYGGRCRVSGGYETDYPTGPRTLVEVLADAVLFVANLFLCWL